MDIQDIWSVSGRLGDLRNGLARVKRGDGPGGADESSFEKVTPMYPGVSRVARPLVRDLHGGDLQLLRFSGHPFSTGQITRRTIPVCALLDIRQIGIRAVGIAKLS